MSSSLLSSIPTGTTASVPTPIASICRPMGVGPSDGSTGNAEYMSPSSSANGDRGNVLGTPATVTATEFGLATAVVANGPPPAVSASVLPRGSSCGSIVTEVVCNTTSSSPARVVCQATPSNPTAASAHPIAMIRRTREGEANVWLASPSSFIAVSSREPATATTTTC